MSTSLVMCPATDELEFVDYRDSPLGPLIHGCSRFRPPATLTCGRECARGTRIALPPPVGTAPEVELLEPQPFCA